MTYHYIRKIHMYAGLLTFNALVVYGISGLWATFQPAPDQRTRPAASVRYQLYTPPAGLTDKQVADHVYHTLRIPLSSEVPAFAVRRNRDNDLAFDFYTTNGVTRVTVLEKEHRVRVETSRNDRWQFIDNLHTTTWGLRAPDLRVRLWKYYNELALWSLSGMELSGVYLWLASRPSHRWAQLFFLSGAGAFVVLYLITR